MSSMSDIDNENQRRRGAPHRRSSGRGNWFELTVFLLMAAGVYLIAALFDSSWTGESGRRMGVCLRTFWGGALLVPLLFWLYLCLAVLVRFRVPRLLGQILGTCQLYISLAFALGLFRRMEWDPKWTILEPGKIGDGLAHFFVLNLGILGTILVVFTSLLLTGFFFGSRFPSLFFSFVSEPDRANGTKASSRPLSRSQPPGPAIPDSLIGREPFDGVDNGMEIPSSAPKYDGPDYGDDEVTRLVRRSSPGGIPFDPLAPPNPLGEIRQAWDGPASVTLPSEPPVPHAPSAPSVPSDGVRVPPFSESGVAAARGEGRRARRVRPFSEDGAPPVPPDPIPSRRRPASEPPRSAAPARPAPGGMSSGAAQTPQANAPVPGDGLLGPEVAALQRSTVKILDNLLASMEAGDFEISDFDPHLARTNLSRAHLRSGGHAPSDMPVPLQEARRRSPSAVDETGPDEPGEKALETLEPAEALPDEHAAEIKGTEGAEAEKPAPEEPESGVDPDGATPLPEAREPDIGNARAGVEAGVSAAEDAQDTADATAAMDDGAAADDGSASVFLSAHRVSAGDAPPALSEESASRDVAALTAGDGKEPRDGPRSLAARTEAPEATFPDEKFPDEKLPDEKLVDEEPSGDGFPEDEEPRRSLEGVFPPPLDLFGPPVEDEGEKEAMEAAEKQGEVIIETLKNFGVSASVAHIVIGPSVVQFQLELAPGIKVSKVAGLASDLTMALAVVSVRVEAPILGQRYVGIEIPNSRRRGIPLRMIMEAGDFDRLTLPLPMGMLVDSSFLVCGLEDMPHLLVAGTTGSGKSVFVNGCILGMCSRRPPDELRLILVDPKHVEFAIYEGLPHLLARPISDSRKAIDALAWAVQEMERRTESFARARVRNLASFNEKVIPKDRYPHIVVVVDELADLMYTVGKEAENLIVRLAQKARAAGIYLILATQRPSVDVITGLIKANVPARVAFSVPSQTDSRTIIDSAGADKLLGRGDMLFLSSRYPRPIRLQAPFITEERTLEFVEYMKNAFGEPEYLEFEDTFSGSGGGSSGGSDSGRGGGSVVDDPKMEDAIRTVMETGITSASGLQRLLSIGYPKAGRLLTAMEQLGIVGPQTPNSTKPRDILMDEEGAFEALERARSRDLFDED